MSCVRKNSIGDRGFRHGTGGTTGVWTSHQQRVVPGLGWMVLSLQGFSQRQVVLIMLLDHILGTLGVHRSPPTDGTFGEIYRWFMN